MSEIPTDQDWTTMEEFGLSAVLKRLTGHWGHVSSFISVSPELLHSFTCEFSLFLLTVIPGLFQVGGLISGAVDIAYRDIRNGKTEKKKVECRVKDLEIDLSELKGSIEKKDSGFKSDLEAETARENNVEQEAGELRKKVEGLRKKLAEQDKDAIISEFKSSKEYDQALANAGAPEIERCWIIAEKHIKIDPKANWASFIDEFIDAKTTIEEGKGKPEPFDGPSPSFILATLATDNLDQA